MGEERCGRVPNVMSIAGVDPSGGAGLLADVKTISALGGYACGVVAALTAQSTREVSGIMDVPCDFLEKQLDTLFDDVRIDAVKIGMLGSRETVRTVAGVLSRRRPGNVVLDPVATAKSGAALLGADAVGALRDELIPLAGVVTPNLPEAALLLGDESESSLDEMPGTAERLWRLAGGRAVIYLKGGHLDSRRLVDIVFDGRSMQRLEAPRIDTRNTHGTGCTLSSALATLLAMGNSPQEAARKAHAYLHRAIEGAGRLEVGNGHGPVDHFWRMAEKFS